MNIFEYKPEERTKTILNRWFNTLTTEDLNEIMIVKSKAGKKIKLSVFFRYALVFEHKASNCGMSLELDLLYNVIGLGDFANEILRYCRVITV